MCYTKYCGIKVLKNTEHMATKLIKYLKLYWRLIKFAAQTEMEYKGSFILEIFVEVVYFFVSLILVFVIYGNVDSVAGWGKAEYLVIVGINMIFSEILLGVAFIHGLRDLPGKIVRGELDLVLGKPINSQFTVSLWRPYFAMIPSLFAGIIVVLWGINSGGAKIGLNSLIPFFILFIFGLIMAYSIGMMISTLSMWLTNATPLPMLAQQVLFLAKNPYSVFFGAWKIIFLTVLPIAFMVSFPVQTLLGGYQWWWGPMAMVLAVIFLKLSNMFWNFALKYYSSASS